MKIAFFDAHGFEKKFYTNMSEQHELDFFEFRLDEKSVSLIENYDIVCVFVNDHLNDRIIQKLSEQGVKAVVLRCAGYNNVDLEAAKKYDLPVLRVPYYSPHSVAEHAVALMLCLNRKIHKAYYRMKDLNFSLDGLMGMDIFGKTVGVIGCGNIGKCFAKIMKGFSANVLVSDPHIDQEVSAFASYVAIEELLESSDIISLHAPLNPQTLHLIDKDAFSRMKEHVLLINTSRGGLIDSKALLQALKLKKIGGAALDVYEEEENVFFENLSDDGLQDDVLARLLTFPNVLVTSHQAFLTTEALENIAKITLDNINAVKNKTEFINQL
tara:strand:+ start:6282 stop:7259 length:978 start_codon:yes stop_codon:yes gene_type:complete